MIDYIRKNKAKSLLWFFIIAYVVYFSWFTIMRMKSLYTSYYDLGIMHQTVYNSYMAIKTGDWGRFLEMTNTVGPEQIKRIAIHNDLILGLLAPFYFIYTSPYTLLVIQSLVVGLGAYFVFKISQIVFSNSKFKDPLSVLFSLAYLLYPPLELSNIYDFHAVVLATTLLLGMFYFWLVKKFRWSFLFFILALLTKEEVALTTAFFGLFALYSTLKLKKSSAGRNFAWAIVLISGAWFYFSNFVIIPYFRHGDAHFAAGYFEDLKEQPLNATWTVIISPNTYKYLSKILGPAGFLSLLSPLQLLIALPEFTINLFSKSQNMRNIIYHYTAVLTPFVFISAIYGGKRFIKKFDARKLFFYLGTFVFLYAVIMGPLPFSKHRNIHPYAYPQKEGPFIREWAQKLKDDNIKISSTGQLAPYLTNHRYFYTFSKYYKNADYVVVRLNEIYNYPEKKELIPVYEKMILDPSFVLIDQEENFEVYKNLHQ